MVSVRRERIQNTPASARLVPGPSAAIANAGPGPFSSALAAVNPPKNTSVMPWTSIPLARAATAWAASCRNTEPKNTSAPNRA